jgi:hypothetical protein
MRAVQFIPAVTRKYEKRARAKITMAEGWTSHEGFLSLMFGTARMLNGI